MDHHYFELRRLSSDVIYQFDRAHMPNGDIGYKRRDRDLWIVWKADLGWVAYDDASDTVMGRPWHVLPQHQSDHPPEGE